jgi:hypothetical protein
MACLAEAHADRLNAINMASTLTAHEKENESLTCATASMSPNEPDIHTDTPEKLRALAASEVTGKKTLHSNRCTVAT